MTNLTLVLTMVGLLLGQTSALWAGNTYKSMAKSLSKAARQGNIAKIAVISFDSLGNDLTLEGKKAAEAIATHLVLTRDVQVIERGLLGKIMKEHQLMATGIAEPRLIKEVGRILPVDALVTGYVVSSKGGFEIYARMIEVETGRVIFAATKTIKIKGIAKKETKEELSDFDQLLAREMQKLSDDLDAQIARHKTQAPLLAKKEQGGLP